MVALTCLNTTTGEDFEPVSSSEDEEASDGASEQDLQSEEESLSDLGMQLQPITVDNRHTDFDDVDLEMESANREKVHAESSNKMKDIWAKWFRSSYADKPDFGNKSEPIVSINSSSEDQLRFVLFVSYYVHNNN